MFEAIPGIYSAYDRQIRLGLRMVTDHDWKLHPTLIFLGKTLHKKLGQPTNKVTLPRANRRHHYDLSANEFVPFIIAEHPRFEHAMVGFARKAHAALGS